MSQKMLAQMIALAADAHSNQFDKSGKPYILHTLKVMHYLKTDDTELQCIAVGHDLIEDCSDWLRTLPKYEHWFSSDKATQMHWRTFLLNEGFTERIINGIFSLTKIPGESYEEYKNKVKSNPDAVKVKMADLRHNLDIRRLKGITEKDIERIRKYHEFYLELIALEYGEKQNDSH